MSEPYSVVFKDRDFTYLAVGRTEPWAVYRLGTMEPGKTRAVYATRLVYPDCLRHLDAVPVMPPVRRPYAMLQRRLKLQAARLPAPLPPSPPPLG